MTVRISTASGSERGFPRESRSLPLAVLIQSDFPYMQLQSALASRGGPVCETVFPLVVCQADQLPILQLLQTMRGPAGNASDRKGRREEIRRQTQAVQQERGEELDVGVEAPIRFALARRSKR